LIGPSGLLLVGSLPSTYLRSSPLLLLQLDGWLEVVGENVSN
jgi:hypothetical protein